MHVELVKTRVELVNVGWECSGFASHILCGGILKTFLPGKQVTSFSLVPHLSWERKARNKVQIPEDWEGREK